MFNRTIDKLKGYALGTGTNPLHQNIADYGTAAALGTVGQQVMNWTTLGADPNALVSGVLAAPLVTGLLRGGRSFHSPEAMGANQALQLKSAANPYEQAALRGSAAAALTGGATSLYNTLTSGTDYDNNLIAGGAGVLTGIAPIAASLINQRRNGRNI